MAPLLEVRNLSRHFGGLIALDNLSLSINAGEIVGLIGPNGAGKSTLFNVITGFFPPTNGEIIYKGENVSNLKPHHIARRGIVRTFQLTVLYPEFTAIENVLLGGHIKSSMWRALFYPSRIPKAEVDRAGAILEFVGLAHLKDAKAGQLPHGHQRMLGLGIALAAEPDLLLLDEPVTGMNVDEIKMMTDLIRTLHSTRKITIMLVEHNVKTVVDVCQRIIALNFGRKIAEGSPDEIRSNKDVIEAYLGPEAPRG